MIPTHRKSVSLYRNARKATLYIILLVFQYLGIFVSPVFASDKLYFIHTDHLGSTVAITDEDGELVSQSRHFPYGGDRLSAVSGQLSATERNYTSQIKDSETQLYYYNARYYDPALGVFVSADTAGDSLNRFAYVGNNPIMATDPSGHAAHAGGGGGGSEPPLLQRLLSWAAQPPHYQSSEYRTMMGSALMDMQNQEAATEQLYQSSEYRANLRGALTRWNFISRVPGVGGPIAGAVADFWEGMPITHYVGMAVWPEHWQAGAYKALSEIERGYFAMGVGGDVYSPVPGSIASQTGEMPVETFRRCLRLRGVPEDIVQDLTAHSEGIELSTVGGGFGDKWLFRGVTEYSGMDVPAHISHIQVPTNVRGQGYGRAIVGAWEGTLRIHGQEIAGIVNVRRDAYGFWEKMGYQRSWERPNYLWIKSLGVSP